MRRAVFAGVCRLVLLGVLLIMLLLSTASHGALLALLLLPCLLLAGILWNLFASRTLEAGIFLPASAEKHQTVEAQLRLQGGHFPILGRCFAFLELQNRLTGQTAHITVPLFAAHGVWEGRCALTTDYCGQLRLTLTRVFLLDLFGAVPISRRPGAQALVTVLPDTFQLRLPSALRACGAPEGEPSGRRGQDLTELRQLRAYEPGDDVRGIHWKLTAKYGTPLFREPSQPVSQSLLLFWDPEQAGPAQADALAGALFSVCQALCEDGIPFTLAFTRDAALQLEPIADLDALTQCLPLILRCPGGDWTLPRPDFGTTLRFAAVPCPEEGGLFQLLCTSAPSDHAHALCFTPEGCAEALQNLDVAYEEN